MKVGTDKPTQVVITSNWPMTKDSQNPTHKGIQPLNADQNITVIRCEINPLHILAWYDS